MRSAWGGGGRAERRRGCGLWAPARRRLQSFLLPQRVVPESVCLQRRQPQPLLVLQRALHQKTRSGSRAAGARAGVEPGRWRCPGGAQDGGRQRRGGQVARPTGPVAASPRAIRAAESSSLSRCRLPMEAAVSAARPRGFVLPTGIGFSFPPPPYFSRCHLLLSAAY